MIEEATQAIAPGPDLEKIGAKWKMELERASRYFEKWRKRCEKIEKIFLMQQDEGSSKRTFPMLWANVSVLQPAVYARTPVPAVERRFKDSDPVARIGSEMVERVLTYQSEKANFDSLLRQVRDDYLLFARGTAWLRYEADIESSDMGVQPSEGVQQEQAQAQMQERITGERVVADYVHWSDFLHSPARRWEDVTWVARRVPMEEDDIKARFGEEAVTKFKAEEIGKTQGKTTAERAQNEGKVFVWEIWCKTENYAVWLADGSQQALEVSEPPLDLEDFWPCPKPAFGTISTGQLIPVPDYAYYQGQVEEIDTLTMRIVKLTDQLRLKGFYPAGEGDVSSAIEKALQPQNDTVMVPVPAWAAFTEKGGANAIVWLPVDQVQKTIVACIEARKQLIEDVYQITGISDIVRGDSQASETATAQRLKSQWGSIRIRERQNELSRFAKDLIKIAGEIVCDLFQPETLMMISGMQLPTNEQKAQIQAQLQQQQQMAQQQAALAQRMGQEPPPPPEPDPQAQKMLQEPSIDDVVKMLRDDNIRGFRIDIETDSTIQPDEDAEKQRRIEFMEVVGGFIGQAIPVIQAAPPLVPAVGEILLFVARGFRTGRQLENVIEQAVAQLTQQVMQPPAPPQPSPDEQIKLETTKIKAQAEQQKAQMDMQTSAMDHQAKMREMTLSHHQNMQQTAAQPQQQLPQ